MSIYLVNICQLGMSCEHLSVEHMSCEHLSFEHMSCEHAWSLPHGSTKDGPVLFRLLCLDGCV